MNPLASFSPLAGFAHVACATFRYFYPGASCPGAANGATGNGQPQPRPAANAPARTQTTTRLQAYPTPSHDQVTVQFSAMPPAGARLELREVVTGRVVRQQAASAAAAQLAVGDLVPGVYVSRLLDADGQVLGTGKVVVVR